MTGPAAVDRDRAAAYDAERFAFEGTWLYRRLTRAQAMALTRTVLDAPGWKRLLPEPVLLVDTRRRDSFCTGDRRIGFGTQVEVSTIAHELAHAVAHTRHPGSTGHGAEWRGWFVAVTDVLHGPEAAAELRHAFSVYGLAVVRPAVEWTAPPLMGESTVPTS